MIFFLTLMILVMGLSGCKKGTTSIETPVTDDVILAMTNQALADMEGKEAYAGDPGTGIYMDDDGIAPVFLADESDFAGDDAIRPNIRKHRLIKCLKQLSLTEIQASAVKKSLQSYDACKDHAVKRAKAIYLELQATYKKKYERIYQAYLTGSITQQEFKNQVEKLRIAFKHELRKLHLKEKLDNAFAKCYREFLGELKSALTAKQWKAFTECYRKQ